MRAAVDRNHGEPGVLFKEEREVLVALHDLHRLRRVDGARHAERKTGAGVGAVGRIVLLTNGLAPTREREIREALEVFTFFGQVRRVRLLPDAAEVHFAGRQPRRRSGGWTIVL